jgi:hypothetical protein
MQSVLGKDCKRIDSLLTLGVPGRDRSLADLLSLNKIPLKSLRIEVLRPNRTEMDPGCLFQFSILLLTVSCPFSVFSNQQ